MTGLRLLIVSGAVWAAAGIATGITRSVQETAPAATAESPEPVLVEILHKADRLPIAAVDNDNDKMQSDARSDPPLINSTQLPSTPVGTVRTDAADSPGFGRKNKEPRENTKTDRLCGARGRHWYTGRHGWRFWRCNR